MMKIGVIDVMLLTTGISLATVFAPGLLLVIMLGLISYGQEAEK